MYLLFGVQNYFTIKKSFTHLNTSRTKPELFASSDHVQRKQRKIQPKISCTAL